MRRKMERRRGGEEMEWETGKREGEQLIAEDRAAELLPFAVLVRREKRAGLERREDGEAKVFWEWWWLSSRDSTRDQDGWC